MISERAHLAALAKVIRQCAEVGGNGDFCLRDECQCKERSDAILALLTPEMLEAEKNEQNTKLSSGQT